MSDRIRLRRPVDADHAFLVARIDEWWGGRRLRALLPRLWLRHFTGTSWVAEDERGTIVGFLIGFVSPDRPDEASVHMIGTSPNRRREGIGRRLYERFFDDVARRGVTRVSAITWPGNRVAVDFHRRLGFRPDDGPGSVAIYGVPAYDDYDGEGEDRAVLVRELGPAGPSADGAR